MIVADASVLVPALGDDAQDGDLARRRLLGEALAAPDLLDLEVTSVLGRLVRAGTMPARRAEQALADLIRLPLRRLPHRALLPRCWELRDTVTTYDAAYVAAAEVLGATLLTADLRLARAPGSRCTIETLP